MPRRIGRQKGSVMSKNITPTLLVRLLCRKRAMRFGRGPSLRAGSSICFLVAVGIEPARGALFRTMETVAGEKPLRLATSRMVTASDLLDERFTIFCVAASSGKSLLDCNGGLFTGIYSEGTSKDNCSRNPRVFQAPKAIPKAIQMVPRILAGTLRLHQRAKQMKKPRIGGAE